MMEMRVVMQRVLERTDLSPASKQARARDAARITWGPATGRA